MFGWPTFTLNLMALCNLRILIEVDKGFENSAPVEDDVPAVIDLEDMMLLALEADSRESSDDSDGDNDNVEGEVSNQYACAPIKH